MDKVAGERNLPLLVAEHLSIESFDAPFFAAICNENLNAALKRIQEFKLLIGPMTLDLRINSQATSVIISCYGYSKPLPTSLCLTELVYFTQLARLATRFDITPTRITLPELPKNKLPFEQYFGCKLSKANEVSVCFSVDDATRPFLTHNATMWQFFEGTLNQKLHDLTVNATIGEH